MTGEELKNQYMKAWKQGHKDRVRLYNSRYWAKKAKQLNEGEKDDTISK